MADGRRFDPALVTGLAKELCRLKRPHLGPFGDWPERNANDRAVMRRQARGVLTWLTGVGGQAIRTATAVEVFARYSIKKGRSRG